MCWRLSWAYLGPLTCRSKISHSGGGFQELRRRKGCIATVDAAAEGGAAAHVGAIMEVHRVQLHLLKNCSFIKVGLRLWRKTLSHTAVQVLNRGIANAALIAGFRQKPCIYIYIQQGIASNACVLALSITYLSFPSVPAAQNRA